MDSIDQIVLSLTARGLTTGEVVAHFAEVYGASVSKDTIGRITENIAGELVAWSARPLDAKYPVVFVDAIVKSLQPVHAVPSEAAARDRFTELTTD